MDFLSMDCLLASYYTGVYTASLFPAFLAAIVWVTYGLRVGMEKAAVLAARVGRQSRRRSAALAKAKARDDVESDSDSDDDDDDDEGDSGSGEHAAVLRRIRAEHMRAFLLLIYVFVPPVSQQQFVGLDCVVLADGQSYLRADTSVDCNSSGYKQFVVVDACLIVVYQSLPLLYILLLFQVPFDGCTPCAGEHSTSAPRALVHFCTPAIARGT